MTETRLKQLSRMWKEPGSNKSVVRARFLLHVRKPKSAIGRDSIGTEPIERQYLHYRYDNDSSVTVMAIMQIPVKNCQKKL